MLTDLADVARSAQLHVVELDRWPARGHGPMNPSGPRTVTVHHTAGPATGDAPSLGVVRDGRPDLAGPLAHYLLARSGTVYVVAAGLAWHTGRTREPWQANAYSIGIEVENAGTPTDRYPAEQLEALRRLCRALCDHYGIPIPRVLGHREICAPPGRKIDPLPETLDMRAFRAALITPQEVPMTDTPTCKAEPVAGVWQASVRNAFGDIVSALQVLNGIEKRLADLQTELAAVKDRLGG
jgi:hypothetical protein